MDKSLFTYKGVKLVLFKLSLITLFQSGMVLLQAYYLADAISSLFRGDLFRTVGIKLFIFVLALFLRHLLSVWKKQLVFHFAANTSENLRAELLQKLFRLGPRFVGKEGSGMTVTLVMEGIQKFRRYLELFLVKLVNMIFFPVAIVIFTWTINIRSAIILVVTLPILIVFLILLGLAAKSKADLQFESYQTLSNHFVDSMRGLSTLKYLGLSKDHVSKIKDVSEKYRLATMKTLRIAFLSSFALDFFTMLSIATVAVFLGLGLINGSIDLHPALTILILAPEYFLPIRELGADYHATLDGKNAGKKIADIISMETAAEKDIRILNWNDSSDITIKHLTIQHDNTSSASLSGVNYTVSGRKKIGIIGASGAGKSTFIDFLSGFLQPTSAEILINEAEISTLSAFEWQKQVTYIPQHPYIFNDTIANNIRFYEPKASEKEVWEAAEKAGLLGMIQSLPQGLETMIGEGGRSLSGGQEQRIALARAFLGKRPIVMLDEPTAHLDIETEAELKETMVALFADKLVFLATHRLHWMLDMDEIIVLDQGRIVETGSHEQLMKAKSMYYQLVRAQEGDGLDG
ncbi:thiol reductant ABC exporter subunit CydD [Bacillus rubiinfantis]|uniref:thiol reductant ABC exporter subunit CydD n=1 Tax=Bacillus rubiinfantis TaxID=1499680 RepID=UPI0005AAD35C|nr:thiol reductant ABC exporter subunit CydD [Bacillus rubiinfantis]